MPRTNHQLWDYWLSTHGSPTIHHHIGPQMEKRLEVGFCLGENIVSHIDHLQIETKGKHLNTVVHIEMIP
jgi:formate dehydrogenase assembly factor FdhD